MKTNVQLGLQVLRRALAFLESEVDVPAKLAPISRLVDGLSGLIDRLSALAAEQFECDRGYRDTAEEAQALARSLLREYVRPVVRLGKLVYPVQSPLRSTLKSPDEAVGYVELMVAAEAIADRVEEHKAKFVEIGLGEDFVDRVRGAIAALSKTLERKADYYGRRSAATSGLNLEFARSRDMMRVLDTMVAPRLEGTEALAQWRTLSRFVHKAKPERVKEQESPVAIGSTSASPTPAVTSTIPTRESYAA